MCEAACASEQGESGATGKRHTWAMLRSALRNSVSLFSTSICGAGVRGERRSGGGRQSRVRRRWGTRLWRSAHGVGRSHECGRRRAAGRQPVATALIRGRHPIASNVLCRSWHVIRERWKGGSVRKEGVSERRERQKGGSVGKEGTSERRERKQRAGAPSRKRLHETCRVKASDGRRK